MFILFIDDFMGLKVNFFNLKGEIVVVLKLNNKIFALFLKSKNTLYFATYLNQKIKHSGISLYEIH